METKDHIVRTRSVYTSPEIREIGDAGKLTLGNASGGGIDPGVPPIDHAQRIIIILE